MRKYQYLILIYINFVCTACLIQTAFSGVNSVNDPISPKNIADDRALTSLADSRAILVDLSWKFEVSTKSDVNGVEVPEADISVIANNEVIKVGRYPGFPREVKNISKSRMPKDTILACKIWFGGTGEDTYLKKTNDTTIEVYLRHVDEADSELSRFEKIKEIKFPSKIEIRTIKPR